MDDESMESVRAALRAATRDIQPSPELDARVSAILADRGRMAQRRWLVPALAATLAAVVAVTAVVLRMETDDGDGRVVTAGPDGPTGQGWHISPPSPFGERRDATLVWTGREAIVWGGVPVPPLAGDAGDLAAADGAALDPATGTWRRIAPGPLAGRYGHVAVWTGTEMIVWGGVVNPGGRPGPRVSPNDGSAYDPISDSWRRLAAAPPALPAPRGLGSGQLAVWSGSEMLVWGGLPSAAPENAGAAYDPVRDVWRPLPAIPGILASGSLVWTGKDVVVFSRRVNAPPAPEINALDPRNGSWRTLPESQLSPALSAPTAVWTGEELLVAGVSNTGMVSAAGVRTTARFSPADGAWREMAPLPVARRSGLGAQEWTGRELLALGGQDGLGPQGGARFAVTYSPVTDEWRTVSVPPELGDRLLVTQGDGGVLFWSESRIFRYRS